MRIILISESLFPRIPSGIMLRWKVTDFFTEIPQDSLFTDAAHAAREHNEDSVRTSHALRSHPPSSFYHPTDWLLRGTYRTRDASLDGQQRNNLVRPSSFVRTK